jgi:hypothetical protein
LIGECKLVIGHIETLDGGRLTDDVGSGRIEALLPGMLVITDVIRVEPDIGDVVKVVANPGIEGLGEGDTNVVKVPVDCRVGRPEEDGDVVDSEETIGVISGVRVMRLLKRLGGAMLFSHSVVPLITEK